MILVLIIFGLLLNELRYLATFFQKFCYCSDHSSALLSVIETYLSFLFSNAIASLNDAALRNTPIDVLKLPSAGITSQWV